MKTLEINKTEVLKIRGRFEIN